MGRKKWLLFFAPAGTDNGEGFTFFQYALRIPFSVALVASGWVLRPERFVLNGQFFQWQGSLEFERAHMYSFTYLIQTKAIWVLAIFFLFSGWVRKPKMVGKQVPRFEGKTLNGLRIDSAFFQGKVTFLNFMYMGCIPCMHEARLLSDVHQEFRNTDFQILCIAPHTSTQLEDFNSDTGSRFYPLRKHFKIEKIRYEILPECDKEDPNRQKVRPDGSRVIAPECNTISKLFMVDGYPQSFLIDKKGMIRFAYSGFPLNGKDTSFVGRLRKQIHALL